MNPRVGEKTAAHVQGGPAVRIAESSPANQILVIGVGNEYASDDAAGLLMARNLKGKVPERVAILESEGDGASLIEAWKGAISAIVIDAVRAGVEPGRVYRFEAHLRPLPVQPFQGSTHAFGLYEAVELARSLNQLPRILIVYGIEGRNFQAGSDTSPALAKSVEKITQLVLKDLEDLRSALPTSEKSL